MGFFRLQKAVYLGKLIEQNEEELVMDFLGTEGK